MSSPFKAYDIRGIYPTEINEGFMEVLGKSFAKFVSGNKIAVGYDMRESSKSLFNSFVKGVISQGKTVINFGLTSTPMSYFASCYLDADGTAMITASHNPGQYNGVKLCLKKAIPISEKSGLKKIEQLVFKNKFTAASIPGQVVKINLVNAYRRHLLSQIISSTSKLKVVVDTANGMGSKDYNLVSTKLPVITNKLYFKLDGSFPNHDANPMKKGATTVLKQKVLSTNSDLGIAFDGDADRVFFIDEKGRNISSDLITALLAEEILEYTKGTILYDLRSSKIVKEIIKSNEGKPKECRVGHSFIKASMRKTNAIFAGELSGHFYFPYDINGIHTVYDSGIVTVIHLINLLQRKKQSLSFLIAPLKKYFSSGEINSKVLNKDKVLKILDKKYSSKGKSSKLDGLKVTFNDWWFNVRPSNTEPLLRLTLEATSRDLMKKKKTEILKIIRA